MFTKVHQNMVSCRAAGINVAYQLNIGLGFRIAILKLQGLNK
jgi:hypothetical protein